MTVEVTAPTEFQGSVLSGLTKRHAVITGQDATEGYFSVFCEVNQQLFLFFYKSYSGKKTLGNIIAILVAFYAMRHCMYSCVPYFV